MLTCLIHRSQDPAFVAKSFVSSLMDPVSAIGLASSAAQLVTFSSDLISKSREIYRSADSSLVKYEELEAIARTLHSQSRRIQAQLGERRAPSQTGRDLYELCNGVRDVSSTLIGSIEGLKAESSSKIWKSFRQALKSVWKEQEIEDLLRRLELYREQIDSLLLLNLQERLQLFTEITEDKSAKIDENFAKILKSIEPSKKWQTELIETARQSLQAHSTDSANHLDAITASLSAGAKGEREALMQRRTIESLNFSDLRDRYERISEAHQKTFDWVFRESSREQTGEGEWSNFCSWLQSDASLYWITGKPGSGKSTLMKYLSRDLRVQEHLKAWNNGQRIYIGTFFFWNSGTTIQMSRIGLMRSLLHQTMSEFPEEVPRAFPERWRYQELFGYDSRPWSWSELLNGFETLVSDRSKSFLFFIDGLDEFDGDCEELVHLLLRTSSNGKNIKLCVASRPWLVFEDAFQRRPSLRLEELTLKDIRLFASEKLNDNIMFAQLQDHDFKSAARLIEAVTKKSSGVFLWVRLVIKSLLEGLRDGDTVEDLQARLLLIPEDLDLLFQKILGDLDAAYLEQAARILQTVSAADIPWRTVSLTSETLLKSEVKETSRQHDDARSPLSLLSLSFIEEDVQRAFSAEYGHPISYKEQEYRAETMRRRLNSRCKGLLEAPNFRLYGPETKVQYLHRTVKDFFDEDRGRAIIASVPQDFDPHIALCAALVRHTKAINPKEATGDDDASMRSFSGLLSQFIVQCHWIEKIGRAEYVPFLDEMTQITDAILGSPVDYWDPQVDLEIPHWTKRIDSFVGAHVEISSVIDYAVVRSLYLYVKRKCDDGYSFSSNRNRSYLLSYARHHGDDRMVELIEFTMKHTITAPGTHKKSHFEQNVTNKLQEASKTEIELEHGGTATFLKVPKEGQNQTQRHDRSISVGFRDGFRRISGKFKSHRSST